VGSSPSANRDKVAMISQLAFHNALEKSKLDHLSTSMEITTHTLYSN